MTSVGLETGAVTPVLTPAAAEVDGDFEDENLLLPESILGFEDETDFFIDDKI